MTAEQSADYVAPQTDDLATKLHDTTNAAVWAEEFLKVVGGAIPPSEDGGAAVDFGLMVGWFANAIETGRNAGRAQFREDMLAAVHSVYFGTFPRLGWDAPAPPLEGGDWGLAEDLDDGRMGEPSGFGDGAER